MGYMIKSKPAAKLAKIAARKNWSNQELFLVILANNHGRKSMAHVRYLQRNNTAMVVK